MRNSFTKLFYGLCICCTFILGCEEDPVPTVVVTPNNPPGMGMGGDTTTLDDGPIDFSVLTDTYGRVASADQTDDWMHFNVHDPAYVVEEDFTWCYNTDVAFGHAIRPGIQIRRSINLVEWEFVGWALPGIPAQARAFIQANGGQPVENVWAPYVQKVGDEYRLYYSQASTVGRLSAIGLATSDNPAGPFTERGLVVTSLPDGSQHTNAIDPSILITPNGRHWMYYGSSWDAIWLMELNPDTGLALRTGDKGFRVAHRGFTNNIINGNIEGPEIIYNPDFNMYYLFIAYDWLATKYNTRVGRSESPEGPFLDYLGNDMNQFTDNGPMIVAPYRFSGHSGWQGVSHPGVFNKNGDYYIGHQGRPGENEFYMVMHVRQLFWTEDGWPVASPQRYAAEEETPVEEGEISGEWELILYDYNITPGFAETQTSPDFIDSTPATLNEDGSVTGSVSGTWAYAQPWLTLSLGGQTFKLRAERGRDWENEVAETILLTGLDESGTTGWGKRIED